MANTTWNPSDKSTNVTLTGSNLVATNSSGAGQWVRAIDKQITGKFYWEITATTSVSPSSAIGIASSTAALQNSISTAGLCIGMCGVNHNGIAYVDGNTTGLSFGTMTSGTVLCIAFDVAARLIWFRYGAAGNWNTVASANPATGIGGIACTLGAGIPAYPMACFGTTSDVVTANFGDTAFTGTVPSGFTSGFTAGTTSSTNALASQAAVEHWLTTNPDAQVTQVALEQWITGNPQFQVTQVAIEQWVGNSPQFQVTQVAIEHWTSVKTTFARPRHPTTVLSASRAGLGSAVVS